jgi:carboxylesterase type B
MEADGLAQMREFGASSLTELRAASPQDIFENFPTGGGVNVDGWFLPKSIFQTFADGEQHPVYLMTGTNRDEANFFGPGIPDLATYRSTVNSLYGDMADEFMAIYPARNDTEANAMGKQAFNDEMAYLARNMAKYQADWGFESYVYFFTRVPPGTNRGATHVTELAYVFNQHDQHPELTTADLALADAMATYWVSFARSSRAAGQGLPAWNGYTGNEPGNVMVLGEEFSMETQMVPSAQALEFFEDAHFEALD